MQVMDGMLRKCGKEDLLIFVGIARRLWMRRNEVLHGGNFWQPGPLVQAVANSMLGETTIHKTPSLCESVGNYKIEQYICGKYIYPNTTSTRHTIFTWKTFPM
jgi:hypothetical protein